MSLRTLAQSRLTVGSTAEATTLFRATGALADGPDRLAARLLPWAPNLATLVKLPVARQLVAPALNWLMPGAVEFELRRTGYMDEVLVEEVRTGATQVVVLGAGFDSRAYRMADELAGTAVFEVDQPAMSARKRARVRAALAGGPPENVTYVGVDLEHDDLAEALARNGYDATVRTLVIWSGVSIYLARETVDATLRWVAGQAPGSCVVFDYCWQEVIDGTVDSPIARAVMRSAAALGEPWCSGLPRGRVEEYLAAQGLEADEIIEKLQADAGPGWHFGGFARARVPE